MSVQGEPTSLWPGHYPHLQQQEQQFVPQAPPLQRGSVAGAPLLPSMQLPVHEHPQQLLQQQPGGHVGQDGRVAANPNASPIEPASPQGQLPSMHHPLDQQQQGVGASAAVQREPADKTQQRPTSFLDRPLGNLFGSRKQKTQVQEIQPEHPLTQPGTSSYPSQNQPGTSSYPPQNQPGAISYPPQNQPGPFSSGSGQKHPDSSYPNPYPPLVVQTSAPAPIQAPTSIQPMPPLERSKEELPLSQAELQQLEAPKHIRHGNEDAIRPQKPMVIDQGNKDDLETVLA